MSSDERGKASLFYRHRRTEHGSQNVGCASEFEPVPEDNIDSESNNKTSSRFTAQELAVMPRHKVELYRMFGDAADDILYPKMVERKRRPMNPKLQKQGGRAGFHALWGTLRGDSMNKLMRADDRIPNELKDAYSAFARQNLARGRPAVSRSYSSRVDIPDMDKLMDRSHTQNTQEYQHKLALMFRASQSNEDKMNILIYNNPPPDLNNMAGHESVDRYLPSWLDGWDKESEASYKKWLRVKAITEGDASSIDPHSEQPFSPKPDISKIPSGNDLDQLIGPDQWDFLRKTKTRKPEKRERKIHFLTEAQARTPGQFTKKFSDLEEESNKPKQYDGPLPTCIQPGIDSARQSKASRSAPPGGYFSQWEPLSMTALVEYTDQTTAFGRGDFNQGRARVFKAGYDSPALDRSSTVV